jgi:hypothetical protein
MAGLKERWNDYMKNRNRRVIAKIKEEELIPFRNLTLREAAAKKAFEAAYSAFNEKIHEIEVEREEAWTALKAKYDVEDIDSVSIDHKKLELFESK